MSSNRSGYGQKRMRVTPELIESLLVQGKALRIDLPDDARLTSMYHAEEGESYYFVFESQEWDELAEGEPLPAISQEPRGVEG